MRRILAKATLASAAFSLFTATCVSAQSWPTHPVSVVVPFTAGTTSDVVARALVGQPFVIDNRGGAGGNIGAGIVAKAKPDGYTLLLATTGPAATNKLMYKDLPFDSQRDFAPIVLIGKSPVIIVARPDLPARSLKELINYAKANPDTQPAIPATARSAMLPASCSSSARRSGSATPNTAAAPRL